MPYRTQTSGLNATQIFIAPNPTSYTSQTTLETLLNAGNHGDIALINASTNAVITAAILEGTKFFIAQLTVIDGVRDIIKSAIFTHTRKSNGTPACDYGSFSNLVAGVKQEWEVTITSTATEAGQTFTLNIVNQGSAQAQFPMEAYSFVSTGVLSADQIANGILAEYTKAQTDYNSYGKGFPSDWVITKLTTAKLKIVSANFDVHGTISTAHDLVANIVNTVAWIAQSGYETQIRQLEYEGKIMNGYRVPSEIHQLDNWGNQYSFVTEGCTYDVIQISNRVIKGSRLAVANSELDISAVIAFRSDTPGTSGSAAFLEVKQNLELV